MCIFENINNFEPVNYMVKITNMPGGRFKTKQTTKLDVPLVLDSW
jgi:hypothetical protein